MTIEKEKTELPIDVVISQAKDFLESGNRWDALEILDDYRAQIDPDHAAAQLLYCRVADALRENGEFTHAHKAVVQAFENRSDANTRDDEFLRGAVDRLQHDLSNDTIQHISGKKDLLTDLNVMFEELYPKPKQPTLEDEHPHLALG